MKHFGDITKLSGWELPLVDCIIGGSPCQDLSQAGLRKGIEGERSGLFMHQIRIVKEMRERDRVENGRPDYLCRPRILGWENVPGAFSSTGGRDFQKVLTEIVRIAAPDAPDVPMPENGRWPKSGCLYDDLGKWSIAYRCMDAQYWGTPQRRKRIALVADFGGLGASEILFERNGLHWHPEQGGEAAEADAEDSGGCSEGSGKYGGGALSFQERAGKPGGGKGILIQNDHVGALGTQNIQRVLSYQPEQVAHTLTERYDGSPDPTKGQGANIVLAFKQGTGSKAGGMGLQEEVAPTLNAAQSGTQLSPAICFGISPDDSNGMKSDNPKSGYYEADTSRTLDIKGGSPDRNQGGMAIVQPLCIEMTSTKNTIVDDGISPTLTARMGTGGNQVNAILAEEKKGYSMQAIGQYKESEQASALKERDYKDATDLVVEEKQAEVYGLDRAAYNQGKNAQFNFSIEKDRIGSMTARGPAAVCAPADQKNKPRMAVRRLTPRECERLNGFPDDWSRWGINEKGEVYELSDSARYKLQGNSIAVGYANRQSGFWMLFCKRISALYERSATLGSLFDGQGGFPLAWEFYNGKGSAVWASEIEKNAIAVTKFHFPEPKEVNQ